MINFPGTGFSQARTTLDLSLVVNPQYFFSPLTIPLPLGTNDVFFLDDEAPLLFDLEVERFPELFLKVCLRAADYPEK